MDYNIDKQTKYKLKYLALKDQHIGEGGHTGDNNLYYQQIYLKYKSKYLALKDQHIGGGYTNSRIFKIDYDIDNNLYYQQKYFKYKLKYLDIKYGGTCKLKVDYDNNLDYQQKYLKYKSKYLDFKKQHIGEGGAVIAGQVPAGTGGTDTDVPVGTKATVTTTPATASKTTTTKTTTTKTAKTPATAPAPATASKTPAPAKTPATAPKAPASKAPTTAAKAPNKNTVPYILENERVVTVSKKARVPTNDLVTFLNDIFFDESKNKNGLVNGDRYRDIGTYMNKVIRDRTRLDKRRFDEIDYNFDNFEDVANMVEKVTHNAILYHFKIMNKDKVATIMERVIEKYFYV
jgi:hypothetical protein